MNKTYNRTDRKMMSGSFIKRYDDANTYPGKWDVTNRNHLRSMKHRGFICRRFYEKATNL